MPQGPTTPDGERLAGWWWRVLASVIDGVILGITSNLLTLPVQADMQSELNDITDRYLDSSPGGTMDFSTFWDESMDVYRDHLVGLLVVPFLFSLAYLVGFLRWKGATPGKLICGLRVRLRERPGTLPWSTIAVRLGVLTVLPSAILVVGLLSGSNAMLVFCYLAAMGFYAVNVLWAAGNSRRQTLHDIAAGTNVVRTR